MPQSKFIHVLTPEKMSGGLLSRRRYCFKKVFEMWKQTPIQLVYVDVICLAWCQPLDELRSDPTAFTRRSSSHSPHFRFHPVHRDKPTAAPAFRAVWLKTYRSCSMKGGKEEEKKTLAHFFNLVFFFLLRLLLFVCPWKKKQMILEYIFLDN